MTRYRSKSGKSSGVTGFEIGTDYIVVEFGHGPTYKYSYKSAGKDAIEEMKMLAGKQRGLSSYISRNDPSFERS